MPRDTLKPQRDPDVRRADKGKAPPYRDGGEARAAQPGGGAMRRGRSGYGMESIRPYLRAQLEQSRLMRPTFPPDPDDGEGTPSG